VDLTKQIVTKRYKPDGSGYTVVAGTTDTLAGEVIDTAGAESVRFIVGFGAITAGAVTSVEVQQDTDSAGGTMADLLGTNVVVAATDDNRIAIIEIVHPRERYLRTQINRATQNSVIDFAMVELYYPRKAPVTQDTATIVAAGVEVHFSPAEGTA
jgi:hypothetical protein